MRTIRKVWTVAWALLSAALLVAGVQAYWTTPHARLPEVGEAFGLLLIVLNWPESVPLMLALALLEMALTRVFGITVPAMLGFVATWGLFTGVRGIRLFRAWRKEA
jgi:hypothetical protein